MWRGTLLSNALEFFKVEDPDIILLQEIYSTKLLNAPINYRLYEHLQEVLPEYKSTYGAAFTDTMGKIRTLSAAKNLPFSPNVEKVESGNAIFSKFEIKSTTNTFFDRPYKAFNEQAQTSFENNPQTILGAKLDAHGVELNAYSVHGIWGFDGKDSERRLQMAETIIQQIEGKNNVIIGGDFNLHPDTKTVQTIEKHVKSVFGNTLIRTFNLEYKKEPGFKTAAVDMMFCSENIHVISKKCPDIQVSDHLPLVVEFEV